MVRLSDEHNPFRQDLMKATHTAPEQLLFMAAEAVAWQEGTAAQLTAVVEDLDNRISLNKCACDYDVGYVQALKDQRDNYKAELEEDNG